MILQLHHAQITVPKGAEDAAREFYCSILGLREIPKPESLSGRGGFWLQLGSFQIHVGTEDFSGRNQTKAHLAYLVEDLAQWRTRLKELGVAILEGAEVPGYARFEFRDPFDNRVEFMQSLKTAPAGT